MPGLLAFGYMLIYPAHTHPQAGTTLLHIKLEHLFSVHVEKTTSLSLTVPSLSLSLSAVKYM